MGRWGLGWGGAMAGLGGGGGWGGRDPALFSHFFTNFSQFVHIFFTLSLGGVPPPAPPPSPPPPPRLGVPKLTSIMIFCCWVTMEGTTTQTAIEYAIEWKLRIRSCCLAIDCDCD